MDLRPYVIWAPQYSQRSAGIRALYMLADQLRQHSQTVEIINYIRDVHQDVILIYPEIIIGNPCKGRQVVRWALKANVMAAPEDQIWAWSVIYLDRLNQKPGRHLTEDDVLHLPLIDATLFNNYEPQHRNGIVFYRANHMRGNNGAQEITGSWPDTRKEMADLLRKSEYLICGNNSLLIDEARFCGCPVLTFGWERPKRSEYGLDGVCWDEKDLPKAKRDVNKALPKYLAYHANLYERIEFFINRTQKGWN